MFKEHMESCFAWSEFYPKTQFGTPFRFLAVIFTKRYHIVFIYDCMDKKTFLLAKTIVNQVQLTNTFQKWSKTSQNTHIMVD